MKALKVVVAVVTGIAVSIPFLIPRLVLRSLAADNNRRIRTWPGDDPVIVLHGR